MNLLDENLTKQGHDIYIYINDCLCSEQNENSTFNSGKKIDKLTTMWKQNIMAN